jgi:GDPmannose 4,6-dehydratase
MFAVNGILFNHEGPRRGETFVTRKITRAVAKIYKEKKGIIYLGNLNAKRDWGYAVDYVESMWKMMQQKKPDDFVISTGESHTVREFVEEAFKNININILWKGKGLKEIGINKGNGRVHVKIDPGYFRPTDINELRGDYSKAKKILGWKPKVKFKDLVRLMVESDIRKNK